MTEVEKKKRGSGSNETSNPINDWLPVTSSRTAKWYYSAFHNVTAMVGAGVLGLPYAMSHLGWVLIKENFRTKLPMKVCTAMQTKKKIMATEGDRLSDLLNSILIHILSRLWESKEVVRTSVLSSRWQFLRMSVPASLLYEFHHCKTKEDTLDKYEERYAKDIDLWVHFATKVANVEEFFLGIMPGDQKYEFPWFANKNARLRNLTLRHCQLNPCGSFHWSSLVFLSIELVELTDGVMETVLSGCPNLEGLELFAFWGIQRLEICSVKLRNLTIESYFGMNHDPWLKIFAPNIQSLELKGLWRSGIRIRPRNVASLVTALLHLHMAFEDEKRNLENQYSYLKELLHSVAHAENLELSPWCIKFMSILELKGWQCPPSTRKFLQLGATLDQLEFPGICSFLQSSSDVETLVIYGSGYNRISHELLSKYTNEDEQRRKFETHYCNGSFLHLKTIKFIDCFGPPSINKNPDPSCGRGRGRGCGRGRGRGRYFNQGNLLEISNNPQHQLCKKRGKVLEVAPRTNPESRCYRCGGKGHWERACRTPKHLVKLYQASLKNPENDVETNFLLEDNVEPMDLKMSDFFAVPEEQVNHPVENMDTPQVLFGSIIDHDDICVIDSGTIHAIIKDEKYFSHLLRRRSNVTTVAGNSKLIEGSRRATIFLPKGTKLVIEDALFSSKSPRNLLSFKDIPRNGYHVETINEMNVEYLGITKNVSGQKQMLEKLPALSSGLYYAEISTIEAHSIVNQKFIDTMYSGMIE
ncbi:hypothetical protein CQW23_00664 [Capsicum baccatum]|uniref:CCHC-type domain-containing protein n=1 Tax=Capsicum baccatum TaxID=33114 RepID=A0A2G2XLR9_CAPBA|nr:hypothetical protein CQW23_00664 [Capsicum baccatum]